MEGKVAEIEIATGEEAGVEVEVEVEVEAEAEARVAVLMLKWIRMSSSSIKNNAGHKSKAYS